MCMCGEMMCSPMYGTVVSLKIRRSNFVDQLLFLLKAEKVSKKFFFQNNVCHVF